MCLNYLGVLKHSGGDATLKGLLQVEIGGLGVRTDLNNIMKQLGNCFMNRF